MLLIFSCLVMAYFEANMSKLLYLSGAPRINQCNGHRIYTYFSLNAQFALTWVKFSLTINQSWKDFVWKQLSLTKSDCRNKNSFFYHSAIWVHLESKQNFAPCRHFWSVLFRLLTSAFYLYHQRNNCWHSGWADRSHLLSATRLKSALCARPRCARMEPPISEVLYWPHGPVPPLGPDHNGPPVDPSRSHPIIN